MGAHRVKRVRGGRGGILRWRRGERGSWRAMRSREGWRGGKGRWRVGCGMKRRVERPILMKRRAFRRRAGAWLTAVRQS